jgi:YfiH family protein
MITWEAPRPYRVVFSTRLGGVSEGPFASLNLGLLTDDEPARVLENRRRLCEEAGVDGAGAAMARQMHGAAVLEAEPRGILAPAVHPPCDGLWTDRSGLALAVVTADCLPVALWRTGGTPGIAVLHAGWKGLLAGILEAGADALGGGRLDAVVGPGIGACCYDVGEEVAGRYRARFGADVVHGRSLDLRASAEVALREAGCAKVEHVDRCTACEAELFFSHRRDGGRTGRQGVIAYVA